MSDLERSRQRRPKEDDINRILTTHAGSIIRPARAARLPRRRWSVASSIDEEALRGDALAARSRTPSAGRWRPASTSSTTARWARRAGSPTCTSGPSCGVPAPARRRVHDLARPAVTGSISPARTASLTCWNAEATVRLMREAAAAAAAQQGAPRPPGKCGPTGTPRPGAPSVWAVHRADELRPGRDRSATSRTSRSPLEDVQVEEAFLPGRGAGQRRTTASTSTTPTDAEFVFAIADALRQEYRAIVEPAAGPGGRRRAHPLVRPFCADQPGALPALGASSGWTR